MGHSADYPQCLATTCLVKCGDKSLWGQVGWDGKSERMGGNGSETG